MAHRMEGETVGAAIYGGKQVDRSSSIRNLFSKSHNFGTEPAVPTSKSPCVYYAENQEVYSFRHFQNMGVNGLWNVARDKRLCFYRLASDREGRACTKARPCNINGCKRNHHHLLHGFAQANTKDGRVVSPLEGAPAHTHTSTSKQERATETFSFRTVPVWSKANDCKVKVNAMLDDGSNETFIDEEVP